MSSADYLQITNLESGYQSSKVIFDLSMSIPKTGITALVGRNGAGKSTLLQTITGFIKPISGEIRFENQRIDSHSPFEISKLGIGYIPQERPIFSDLSVRENLLMGAVRLPKKIRNDISEVLELFPKLSSRLDQKAGTMSGGERKMVGIARALIGKPSLLIMDEPTEGVWHGVIEEIQNSLVEYGKNHSILIVEQNIEFVSKAAERIFLLERDRLTANVSASNEQDLVELRKKLTI